MATHMNQETPQVLELKFFESLARPELTELQLRQQNVWRKSIHVICTLNQ